jgi:hypothetical protein
MYKIPIAPKNNYVLGTILYLINVKTKAERRVDQEENKQQDTNVLSVQKVPSLLLHQKKPKLQNEIM